MLYIEVEILLNGNQKPNYYYAFESDLEFLQPVGFSCHLLFLLQLQELHLGAGFCKVFTDPTLVDHSCCALDLQKCEEWELHQYGCFESQATAFALHLHYYCNGHLPGRGFLSSQGNGLGNFYALYSINFDAGQ